MHAYVRYSMLYINRRHMLGTIHEDLWAIIRLLATSGYPRVRRHLVGTGIQICASCLRCLRVIGAWCLYAESAPPAMLSGILIMSSNL